MVSNPTVATGSLPATWKMRWTVAQHRGSAWLAVTGHAEDAPDV